MMYIINVIDTGLIQGLILACVVTSMGISFRLLNFPDLTIDGSFALGAAISVTMVKHGYPIIFAIILSMICGGLSGGITALLHTKLRINKFLSGIIVVTALYSVLIRIMNGGNISFGQKNTFFDFIDKYDLINSFSFGTITFLVGITTIIVLIFYFILKSTFGIKIRAACLNTELAKSVGLKSSIALLIGLFFTNTLAAFSGSLFSLKSSYADIGFIQGMLIISLASLTIGEKIVPLKSLNKLTYVLLASVVGSVAFQMIWAIALKFNLEPSDLNLITALIVATLFFWKRNNKNLSGVELQ
jgi:putative tryptophan/tyrosine transport system permease protein